MDVFLTEAAPAFSACTHAAQSGGDREKSAGQPPFHREHVPQQRRRHPLPQVLVEPQAPGLAPRAAVVARAGVIDRRRVRHLVVDLLRRGVVVERDRTPQTPSGVVIGSGWPWYELASVLKITQRLKSGATSRRFSAMSRLHSSRLPPHDSSQCSFR